jgi:hypothetical protein
LEVKIQNFKKYSEVFSRVYLRIKGGDGLFIRTLCDYEGVNDILLFNKKMSLFHGGIDYWHSCCRIDPFLKDIMEIPSLKMVHICP